MLNSTKTWQEELNKDAYFDEKIGEMVLEIKYITKIVADLIAQTREETIREVEQLIPERKDGGKNFDQWQYYCQGYNDLRDYIFNKLKK